MNLSEITLRNFRSYEERRFEFPSDVTIITGQNGVGKTNLLEAVHMLFAGKSFRDADNDLLKHGTDWFRISGEIDGHHRELRYQPEQQVRKSVVIDDHPAKRFTYHHQLPVVLFEPDDMQMVHGSPAIRRDYLDDTLMKTNPSYRTTLGRYERSLLQRNNILKQNLPPVMLRDAVFVWDVALAEYGTAIQTARSRLVEELNTTIADTYSQIAGKEQTVQLQYDAKIIGSSQRLADGLARALEHDRYRGTTSVGPHRDDLSFHLNGRTVKQTASRGEVRTLVLALKEIELDYIRRSTDHTPLLLMDDVFSELDEARQRALVSGKTDTQIIITTTHAPRVAKANHIRL